MKLYDAIFYRKTTRKYSNKKVSKDLIDEIKEVCENITYINKDLNIKAHVVERGHIIHLLQGKKCKIKAPHYIMVTSTKGEDYLENIGFAIEEVVLNLTTLGIATCWLECDLKRENILEFIELDTVKNINQEEISDEKTNDIEDKNVENPYIMVAFGYTEKKDQLFRQDKSSIDRKSINHISKKVSRETVKIMNAVRFSPSVKNCQPWFLYNDGNNIHIYEKKQKKRIQNLSKISIGISLRHVDVACKNNGIPVTYEKIKHKKKVGKKYYISAILNGK